MFLKILMKKNFCLSLVAMSIVTFSFQNCGQNLAPVEPTVPTSSSLPSANSSLQPCIAGGCPLANEYIQISIENRDPISFVATLANQVLEPSVDVSGYCNTGGFLLSRIYYSIADDSGVVVSAESSTLGSCGVLGRYSFPISTSKLLGNKNYHITVILRAIDSTGAEHENPLGRNRKQIGLSPRTGI